MVMGARQSCRIHPMSISPSDSASCKRRLAGENASNVKSEEKQMTSRRIPAIPNYRHYPLQKLFRYFQRNYRPYIPNCGKIYEMQVSSCSCGTPKLHADTHNII